jgi:hypothetical protein
MSFIGELSSYVGKATPGSNRQWLLDVFCYLMAVLRGYVIHRELSSCVGKSTLGFDWHLLLDGFCFLMAAIRGGMSFIDE